MSDRVETWVVIITLGLGSYLLRFAFMGLVGDRAMPPWLLRHLRYTAAAFLPALAAPLVIWPPATGGELDPPRLAAAIVALTTGVWTKNVTLAILLGAATLYGLLALL